MKDKIRTCTPEEKLGIIFGILLVTVCAASIICSLVKINQRADHITCPYCGYTRSIDTSSLVWRSNGLSEGKLMVEDEYPEICDKCGQGYTYYMKDGKIFQDLLEYEEYCKKSR